MRIGELAERAGTSTRTPRYYEAHGLVRPGRSASGYRVYDEAELRVVREIRALLAVGFGLDDIRPSWPACGRATAPATSAPTRWPCCGASSPRWTTTSTQEPPAAELRPPARGLTAPFAAGAIGKARGDHGPRRIARIAMGKKDRSRQQATEQEQHRKQDLQRSEDWADRAALARTADDPRATAPRDAEGRPSNGRQF